MLKWLDVLQVLAPAIMAVIPGAAPFTPLVVAAIEVAEMTGKPGTEKKEIAKETVEMAAVAANTVAIQNGQTKEVINPKEAVAVADNTIDAIIGAVNLVTKIKANLDKKEEDL